MSLLGFLQTSSPKLIRAVPNENWELILLFEADDWRLFKASTAREQYGWPGLGSPVFFKQFTFTAAGLQWSGNKTLPSSYLHAHSTALPFAQRKHQTLRLSYKNQAPTAEDPKHDVFGVYLQPFGPQPFQLGESIGGGMADRGGGQGYSLAELLAFPGWQQHFTLSGAGWAIPYVLAHPADEATLLDLLIKEICKRGGV